jgi:hypothetical protein
MAGRANTFEGGLLIDEFRRVEAQELGKFASILGILVNSEFQILAESLVELLEVVFVFRDLAEQVHAFLDNVLANDFEDLVLLESLARNVERKILGVDNAFDEVEIFGNEIFAIVHDEDAADIELDVVALLFAFEEIEGSTENPSYEHDH